MVDDRAVKAASEEHPRFAVAAKRLVGFTGSGWAVAATVAVVACWLAIGVGTGFSRGWELTMTAGVPIVTLLVLIVVQHTQNHDNLAMQLKLDELIRALDGSEDAMIRVEDASADHLEELERDFQEHVEQTVDGSSRA